MKGELVAIDLETTGLDPANDEIIEVGAVRMVDGEIVDELSVLVNPGRPIPEIVTHLTGISMEDVAGATTIDKLLPAIRSFVGDVPIIGHNVRFDTGFLYRQGLLRRNVRIDTYELAAVLLPRAPRYNLASLAGQLGIMIGHAHRALDDARATAELYWQLWERMLELPPATLQEIFYAGQGLEWDALPVFAAAVEGMNGTPPDEGQSIIDMIELFGTQDFYDAPTHDTEASWDVIDPDTVGDMIGNGGVLSGRISGYEYRPQQVEMARAVTRAFNETQHIMIEAGTGTGKSLAYLVPSILWASQNDERVVISTNTINLQDQLMHNDIPALSSAMEIPARAALMKGRSNYLCPRRLAALRRRRPTDPEELRMLAKLLVWLLDSAEGDKGEISLRGVAENAIWQRLSAEDDGCMLERCRSAMRRACPFYKARKSAEAAHLVVVNHALLLADAMSDNKVLPEYRWLIIDEAHHLEEAITNRLSFQLDQSTLHRRLADLADPKRGLLAALLNNVAIPDRDRERLRAFIEHIVAAAQAMQIHSERLFQALAALGRDVNKGRASEFIIHVRIVARHRDLPAFNAVGEVWAILKEFLGTLSEALQQVVEAMGQMAQDDVSERDDLVNSIATAARYMRDVESNLRAFVAEPQENMIYWISMGQNMKGVTFNVAPLHIGPLMESHLWHTKESIVLTSATLQTNGNFEHIRNRLFADEVAEIAVGSPFDYRKSTLVFVPNDIPEPAERQGYQRAVERGIVELAAALEGRVLGLFTSYKQLRETAQAITARLALGGITVFDQSAGTSRQVLLDGFKNTEKSVLLGTRSFWEGVDIPGEALSALVIARLPFAVPSDPIFAARSETYTNGFNEYAVPDAILRFRQGFGRLIRRQSDRGVVAVFDRRITSKGYGASFLSALPDCKIEFGPLETLGDVSLNWLGH